MNVGIEESFKNLIVACAGPSREEQEIYLVRLVQKLLDERYGGEDKFPGVKILSEVEGCVIGEEHGSVETSEGLCRAIAKSFLDSEKDVIDLRAEVVASMRLALHEREKIKKEAGIVR